MKYRANIKRTFGDWAERSDNPDASIYDPRDDEFEFEGPGDSRGDNEEVDEDDEFAFQKDSGALAAADSDDANLGDLDFQPTLGEDEHDADEVDLQNVMFINGPRHTLHNMTEGLHVVLALWQWFVIHPKHVCRLLKNEWSKARLLRTCFNEGAAALYESDIKQFSCAVYDKRWGTAMAAVRRLLPIWEGLCFGWNLQRYNVGAAGAARNDDAEDQGGANIEVANEAIESRKFRGYLYMVDIAAWLILDFSAWFDDCPCHGQLPEAGGMNRRERSQYYVRLCRKKCIMRC